MRIVYCTDSICYPGGIAVVTITKANALAQVPGNEVWIVLTDTNGRQPIIPVSEKVKLVDLEVGYYKDDWKSRFHALRAILVKRCRHRRKLEDLFRKIQPDVAVSTGTSEKFFLPRIKTGRKTVFVRELHFTTAFRTIAARGAMAKLYARLVNFWDYRVKSLRYDRIVVLTNEDKHRYWPKDEKVAAIHNPLPIPAGPRSSLTGKKAIAIGRLVAQKDFGSLIRTWERVAGVHPDWTLEIWGEGEEKQKLERQIVSAGLGGNVRLMGYTSNIAEAVTPASLFVCSSLFEGFNLALVESMSRGLPVVSYACPCGPRDIITDGVDGFLVPPGDEAALADRICRLIEDEDLRKTMGDAAFLSSQNYSIDKITARWMDLFNKLLSEKQ